MEHLSASAGIIKMKSQYFVTRDGKFLLQDGSVPSYGELNGRNRRKIHTEVDSSSMVACWLLLLPRFRQRLQRALWAAAPG